MSLSGSPLGSASYAPLAFRGWGLERQLSALARVSIPGDAAGSATVETHAANVSAASGTYPLTAACVPPDFPHGLPWGTQFPAVSPTGSDTVEHV